MTDPHDLQRFHWAQDGLIDGVREELRAGRKTSHWMWFVFPQVAGLGQSATRSREEASAYLADPVLAERLRECCRLLLENSHCSAEAILGSIDALKLRSCMTLFHAVSGDPLFESVLDAFYDGAGDDATLAILESWGVCQ